MPYQYTFTCDYCGCEYPITLQNPCKYPRRYCSTRCRRLDLLVPPEQRFWKKVDKAGPIPQHRPDLGPCWLWQGACQPNGYGSINASPFGGQSRYAHRFSYALHFGAFDDALKVLHKCDVRNCVNPDHLFLGTTMDNHRDMIAKGRNQRGEAHHMATLTEEQVREIRQRYAAGGSSQGELGREFGVSSATIFAIVRGKLWAHAGGEIVPLEQDAYIRRPKLTEQAVREIRAAYAAGGVSMQTVASRFGINGATAHAIIRRKLWKHVA